MAICSTDHGTVVQHYSILIWSQSQKKVHFPIHTGAGHQLRFIPRLRNPENRASSNPSYVALSRSLTSTVSDCSHMMHRIQHTWKKKRTIKTCNAPIHMIRPHWIKLKLTILFSVLRTVLKLRFSRVRKYFCKREMVESWPEIL